MMAQLLSVNKSTGVTILGTGKSSIDNSQLEFPLDTEEEFSQLEASLKNPKFKDSFMAKLAEKLSFNPESSLRGMPNYVMEPQLSSRFAAFGTPKMLALTKCQFYAVIMCKLALFKYFFQPSLSAGSLLLQCLRTKLRKF
uniref:Uncharacterized protein n=1 Tax=Trichobilharzia regenti TaxID=157069 RepID=A0AA85JCI8_TRIRE|nr:unnamed protein product [Trichobilharzia regenti]